MAFDIKKAIGIFLIVAGVLPFLGIGFGILGTIVNILVIASGIYILVK